MDVYLKSPPAKKSTKPRKIPVVKPSKYEVSEALRMNKKYWKSVFNELDTATTSPSEECRTEKLAEVLPASLYEKVCHTLDLPIRKVPSKLETGEDTDTMPRKLLKYPKLSQRMVLTIDRELDSDTDVETSPRDSEEEGEFNIHQQLLQRPEREQITWPTHYLQPEREDEKNLVRRADDLTDRIAQEFCHYMKELGGNQQSQLFTPKAIKELFQVEFDTHAARSISVVPKELPTVQDKIAKVTDAIEVSEQVVLEREITKDIRTERKPSRSTAFNQSLPIRDQWKTPANDTEKVWRSARHVPRDLVTLKTVWEGITNLRSVKEYCRWMIEHPEYRRAPYLKSLGMFDPAVLHARLTFESQHDRTASTAPVPIEQLRRRLTESI